MVLNLAICKEICKALHKFQLLFQESCTWETNHIQPLGANLTNIHRALKWMLGHILQDQFESHTYNPIFSCGLCHTSPLYNVTFAEEQEHFGCGIQISTAEK